MTRKQHFPTKWVLVLLVAVLSSGCTKAARRGLTGGLETGIAAVVQSFFEQAVDSTED